MFKVFLSDSGARITAAAGALVLACVALTSVHAQARRPLFEPSRAPIAVPPGFSATRYASGLPAAAGDLVARTDGTLSLRSPAGRVEIPEPRPGEAAMAMLVAEDLLEAGQVADVAGPAAPITEPLRWNPQAGDATREPAEVAPGEIVLDESTLLFARSLARRHPGRVALATDGSLFVARGGEVWRIRREARRPPIN